MLRTAKRGKAMNESLTLDYHLKFGLERDERVSTEYAQFLVNRIAQLEAALREIISMDCTDCQPEIDIAKAALGNSVDTSAQVGTVRHTTAETPVKPKGECALSNRPICEVYPRCVCGQSVVNQGGKHGA